MSAAPTLPAPSLETRAQLVARTARDTARRARFAEDVGVGELALLVVELAELVDDLAARSLPR